jgi:hypothetical protein
MAKDSRHLLSTGDALLANGFTYLFSYDPSWLIDNEKAGVGEQVSGDTLADVNPPVHSLIASDSSRVGTAMGPIESGYNGTVTFTDAVGTSDVVPIESNGANSANLSNLASGTVYYTLSIRNAAGNVITVDPPLNLGDGSENALVGTPQFATLLSGYAATPSWNLAGVSYAVGIPAGTILEDPATGTLPAGVTRDSADHVFYAWVKMSPSAARDSL